MAVHIHVRGSVKGNVSVNSSTRRRSARQSTIRSRSARSSSITSASSNSSTRASCSRSPSAPRIPTPSRQQSRQPHELPVVLDRPIHQDDPIQAFQANPVVLEHPICQRDPIPAFQANPVYWHRVLNLPHHLTQFMTPDHDLTSIEKIDLRHLIQHFKPGHRIVQRASKERILNEFEEHFAQRYGGFYGI